MAGPLEGLRVIEMAGLGPAPFCAMLFADMGADVIRIARPGNKPGPYDEVLNRGRSVLEVDLRAEGATRRMLDIIGCADVLIEGYRPGVMERLGLGPTECLARNPRLIYGRMTGWGQHGPLAQAAGHDINYIAISGALHAVGRACEAPVLPLNYVGDFGGGAMFLAFGVLSALYESRRSGAGQVIDAAMTDGAALLSAMMYGVKAAGEWSNQRGENRLDGGAHFYNTYACADGKYVAVGAIEPQFYALLLERCGIADDPAFDAQMDATRWPLLKLRMADLFRTRTRDEWCVLLEGSDACFSPVLDWDEAPAHPHNVSRSTFVKIGDVLQPAPAPRFSRTPAAVPKVTADLGAEALLKRWSLDVGAIA